MYPYLLAAFILVPVMELALLLKVGDLLGWFRALVLVVFTGIAGATLARSQGLAVFAELQRDLAQGRMPAPRLIDGLMILIAGVLLLTPGLITDACGLLLLVPPVRTVIRAWLKARIDRRMREGSLSMSFWRL